MQQAKIKPCFFVLLSAFFIIACNEPAATSTKNEKDTALIVTGNDPFPMPAYDPALAPLTVGAQFSKKLQDTLNIKLYEFTLKPGDSAALHTHPDHVWYVVEGGKLAITFKGTGRQVFDLKPGMGAISGPLSDAGKNIGNTTIKLLVADIYRPRGK
jgi:mannose-6-phosphate isomerase-like protein (cupin superfamily)